MRAEEEDKLYAKQRQEEHQEMILKEQQERKKREREAEYRRNLPERQLQILFSGEHPRCGHCHLSQDAEFFGHASNCPYYTRGHDIEPGLGLLKKEYSTGRLIRLDEQTRNRLVEFAKPDEIYQDHKQAAGYCYCLHDG